MGRAAAARSGHAGPWRVDGNVVSPFGRTAVVRRAAARVSRSATLEPRVSWVNVVSAQPNTNADRATVSAA